MKIGIISNLYPPYTRGGAEMVVTKTVGALTSLGHDLFVISAQPRRLGKKITEDRSSGAERIYRFYPRNIYFTLDDFHHSVPVRALWHLIDLFSPRAGESVATICDWERPDVVITHNLKGLGLSVPRALQRNGIPHVHVVHDLQLIRPSGLLFFGSEQPWWWMRPLLALYKFACRVQMGRPDVVIFPSHYLEQAYREAGFFRHSHVRVMPNPAPSFAVEKKPRAVGGPLKLAFAGQLGEHKGVSFLLHAFASLPFDARLYIAGDGPLRKVVERAAEKNKNITYLGYLPNEELSKVFEVADAVIVPSLCYENSPTVIYEALYAGVPVIASRIGGVGELIHEGRSGLLFTPGDRAALVQAVQQVKDAREDFASRREEIQASVADYSLDRYAIRLQEVLGVATAARTR